MYLCTIFPRFGLILMTTRVQEASHRGDPNSDLTWVSYENLLQVITPKSPCLHQRVMELDCCGESLVSVFRSTQLSQKQPFECVKFGRHLLRKVFKIGRLYHVETFLKFIFPLCPWHLNVTLDLLSDLLEAVYNWYTRDGVNAVQRV